MDRYSHFRSPAGGDAPHAVRMNQLENDLKEARYHTQQAEERYSYVQSLITRLWTGDQNAAVQLSKTFNLSIPEKLTDLGLQFTSTSIWKPEETFGNKSNYSSNFRYNNEEEFKPKILSPSRKFCSSSSETSEKKPSVFSESISSNSNTSRPKTSGKATVASTRSYITSYRPEVVPSKVLHNRGLYHSIPVVNIDNAIPSDHVANVIPSSYRK